MPYLNKMPKFTAKETFTLFQKNRINKSTALKRLVKIVDYSLDEKIIIDALDYLEKIDTNEFNSIIFNLFLKLRKGKFIRYEEALQDFDVKTHIIDNYFKRIKESFKAFIERDYKLYGSWKAHLVKLLCLIEARGKKLYPNSIENATIQAIDKIKSLLKDKNIKELVIERKYLLEMFDGNIIEMKETDRIPMLLHYTELKFIKQGIKIEYNGDLIKFINNLKFVTSI